MTNRDSHQQGAPPPTQGSFDATGARIIGACGLAFVLLTLVGLVFFRHDATETSARESESALGHVHGLGIDPADGALFVATHEGLFTVGDDDALRAVGDRRYDTMAFTVIGAGQFLASGHPAPGDDQPSNLGLIASGDTGQTWQSLSLAGSADFHALEASPDGLVWGVDGGRLIFSDDGTTWTQIRRGGFIDLAVIAAEPREVLATTSSGQVLSVGVDGSVQPLVDAPPLVFLDQDGPGPLVGLAPEGAVQVSQDEGRSWTTAGQLNGTPAALHVTDRTWYAATDSGVLESTDEGESWSAVAVR